MESIPIQIVTYMAISKFHTILIFFEYLAKNLRYPVKAQENGIQGNVYVTFYVERDGSLSDIHITGSVDPSLDKEAVRMIEGTKSWIPGKVDGKVVRTEYTKVLRFRLR